MLLSIYWTKLNASLLTYKTY